MDNITNVLLSYEDIALIRTCVSFTKCWAKCFDDDEHRKKCDDLNRRLKHYEKEKES